MAVRWIIGRAGTGKSARCIRDMREDLARDPLGTGTEGKPPPGAVLLITPEQATFTAERMLLAGRGSGLGNPVAGTFRAQVLSFRRLAMLIAREVGLFNNAAGGRGVPKPMDDVARVVLLEETVRKHLRELTVFGGVADRPGFIRKLDNTLRELRQHGHSGASLREIIGDEATSVVDTVTRRKLSDLAVLLDAWSLEVDRTDAWDFEYLMHRAALKVPQAPLVVGSTALPQRGAARVWVDGFSALSTLEIRLLVAMAQHANNLTVTLLAAPDSAAIREMRATLARTRDVDSPGDGAFARTERLHRRLTDAFRQHQVQIESTLTLREQHRFADPALRQVEALLFSDATHQPVAAPGVAVTGGRPAEKPKRKDARRVEATATLFDLLEPAAAQPGSQQETTDLPPQATALVTTSYKTGLEIWESSDPETEVRITAQAIRDLVIGRSKSGSTGIRYRQIGVIVPDLDGYSDAIRRIFAEHAIPHFIDQRRGIAHHPLVELLRSALAIATNRWDRDDMLLYLKTRLAGVSQEDVALIENYLIEHGITHMPWSLPWKWIAPNRSEDDAGPRDLPQSARDRLARVNTLREKVNSGLAPWLSIAMPPNVSESASEGPIEGAAYVRGLRALLTALNIDQQLQAWIDAARVPGSANAELAQAHEQVWREVSQLLTLLESILMGKLRTLQEVERIVNTALESLTLGLIPPTVDQVLVSSVTRSRVPELEVVFILGALEGQFPKVIEEDPILSDAQREAFNARAADPISEGSDRQLLEMPFFDYVAFSRAGKLLVVSYPLANRNGKAVGKSRYIPRLRELLGQNLRERRFDAAARTELDRIGTVDDLLTAVASWARDTVARGGSPAPSQTAEQRTRDEKIAHLYNWLSASNDPQFKKPMSQIWPAVAGRPAPLLSKDLARRFYPPEAGLYLSISQLEKFAACPLQYFAHYTLGLREREPFALDQLNLGVLYHRILERIYRRIIAKEIAWPKCDAQSLRILLEEQVDAAISELHAELADREPSYEKTRARIKRHLGIVLEADRRRACPGSLRPAAVEVFFGGSGGGGVETDGGRIVKLPILQVDTPLHHRVFINGKIDRIDADPTTGKEMSVIDYKSSVKRTLELYRVYAGLALQLPVYALVTRDLAEASPIAALYLGLGVRLGKVQHAQDTVDPESDEFFKAFMPHGIIDEAGVPRLDSTLDKVDHRVSDWYKIAYTTKGFVTRHSEVVPHDDFQTILDYAEWKIADLADALMQGRIAPNPYRHQQESSCERCEFASLCPFDQASGSYREIPKLKNREALDRMRSAMDSTQAPAATK